MLIRILQRLCEYVIPSLKKTPAKNVGQVSSLPETVASVATVIHAYTGDITAYTGDAIVNAANTELMAGGGVCGAIFAKAGHAALQDACDAAGPCQTGEARTTSGFDLPAKFIVHAVGPIYVENQDNAALLSNAYRSALSEAVHVGAKSIAFPAISTGIYGYPLDEATAVAVATVKDFCAKNPALERVDFVCFSQSVLEVYQRHLGDTPVLTATPSLNM